VVACEKAHPDAESVGGHGDDGVDGVIPVGAAEELSSRPTELRRHRVLFDAREEGVDGRVARMASEHLGQLDRAHVDGDAELLGDRKLRSHSCMAFGSGAEGSGIEDDRLRNRSDPQPPGLASPSHCRRTSSRSAAGTGPCSASWPASQARSASLRSSASKGLGHIAGESPCTDPRSDPLEKRGRQCDRHLGVLAGHPQSYHG
jgi:hypothetical protein